MDVPKLVAQQLDLPQPAVASILRLLKADNTVPFIARYRQDETGGLPPESLRRIVAKQQHFKAVGNKAKGVESTLAKAGVLTPRVRGALHAATTFQELEDIQQPYKAGPKRTLAQRARELNLEATVDKQILRGQHVEFGSLLHLHKDLKKASDVQQGVQHLLAERVANRPENRDSVRGAFRRHAVLAVSAIKTAKPADAARFGHLHGKTYHAKHIRPHQVLTINRGAAHKALRLSLTLPPGGKEKLIRGLSSELGRTCHRRYSQLCRASAEDAYTRLLRPRQQRETRQQLTQTAEERAVEVFTTNTRALLLARPVKGEPILAIDPGFKHGCKIAVVDAQGAVLAHTTVFPQGRAGMDASVATICKLLRAHQCTLVAVGDGQGCRETEALMPKVRAQLPAVRYTIVSEAGASIYSASDLAAAELPCLPLQHRAAVSLARRLQDPLAELVKIEPQHLGVGMYQADVPEKLLAAGLAGAVQDCVCLVGIDLNTASAVLLKHVAGITAKCAASIVAHRDEHGPFRTRQELLNVRGIGSTRYTQCAGFLRVYSTAPGCCILDGSGIHPDNYAEARCLLAALGIDEQALRGGGVKELDDVDVEALRGGPMAQTGKRALLQMVAALREMALGDVRDRFAKPVFRQDVMSLGSLRKGMRLAGRVCSVTDFGAFVDCGVQHDGLIHASRMPPLRPGDVLDVVVVSLDIGRKRIGLAVADDGAAPRPSQAGPTPETEHKGNFPKKSKAPSHHTLPRRRQQPGAKRPSSKAKGQDGKKRKRGRESETATGQKRARKSKSTDY